MTVTWCPEGDRLDQDIFDAMSEFFAQLLACGEELAERFGVPMFCIKAIQRLDESVTMKELGRRMRCDPSFVTMIADELEQRGLARREPSATDRRIKNLVLTADGLVLKARVERALLDQMPWSRALGAAERESLLAMTRKMNAVLENERAGEVSDVRAAASRPRHGRRPAAQTARHN
jgi:DNA-binding MarR family transcriptional regulator